MYMQIMKVMEIYEIKSERGKLDKSTVIVGDSNTPPSVTDVNSREKT